MNDFSFLRIIAAIGIVTASCALLCTLPGCGHGQDASAQASQASLNGGIPAVGLEHARQIAREAQVTCVDDAKCPESVGMIVSVSASADAPGASILRCTGALIAPAVVLTSSRCVPAAGCSDRVRFVLPALHGGTVPAQDVACAQALGNPSGDAPVFLRLEHAVSGRQPLIVDTGGLHDRTGFSIPVVNPTSDTHAFGELRMHENCMSTVGTAALPQYSGPLTPMAALAGCPVNPTNYGAPVLDSRQAVRAVVQRDFDTDVAQKSYGALLDSASPQVADFAFAASLACVRLPDPSDAARALPASCAANGLVPSAEAITSDILNATQADLEARTAAWKAAPEQQKIRWGFKPLSSTLLIQAIRPEALCVQGSEQWLAGYHHWIGGYSTDATVFTSVPQFQVTFGMTPMLQREARILNQASLAAVLHFSPRQLAQTGQTLVTLRSQATGAAIGAPTTLSKCSN